MGEDKRARGGTPPSRMRHLYRIPDGAWPAPPPETYGNPCLWGTGGLGRWVLAGQDALGVIFGELVAVEGRVELAGLPDQVNIGEQLGVQGLTGSQQLQGFLGGVAVPLEGAHGVAV